MASFDLVLLTQAVGFGVCLWLGLYLFTRSAVSTALIRVGIVALLAQAAFFGSSMLTFNVHDLATLSVLERSFWWTAVLPSAAWFHFSVLVARQPLFVQGTSHGPRQRLLIVAAYLAALVIIGLGTTTNFFLDYAAPIVGGGERYAYLRRGVAYPAQVAFLVLTGVGALFNLVRALVRARRSPAAIDRALAQQLTLLVGGALLFLIGAIYISSRFNWNPTLSVLPGYLCLFVGLGGLSYGIANFGLLLEGKDIRRDFFYNLTGIGLMNVLYIGGLLLSEAIKIRSLLLVVGLVTLTHMTVDSGRYVLDALFFSRAERAARAEARDYANELGTQPVATPTGRLAEDPPSANEPVGPAEAAMDENSGVITSEKQFKSAVRRGLTSLKSPPQLAKSPLLTLDLVQRRVAQAGLEDNRLNRVAMLRELLIDQIDGLRPKDDESAKTGDAWRFYNVLYYPYVRELSRKAALAEARRLEKERQRNGLRAPGELERVLAWLADVDEDTFYKWQRRASDTIATALWEENAKLRV